MKGRVPDVSGNRVTSLDLDDVARHNLSRRHDDGLAAADDGTGGRAERAQGVHGLLGGILLEETDDDIEQDDKADDAPLDPGLEAEGNRHSEDEDLGKP